MVGSAVLLREMLRPDGGACLVERSDAWPGGVRGRSVDEGSAWTSAATGVLVLLGRVLGYAVGLTQRDATMEGLIPLAREELLSGAKPSYERAGFADDFSLLTRPLLWT